MNEVRNGVVAGIHITEMILRTTFAFVVLLVLARMLGKKQLSQLTFFNYVTGITIGSIAANITTSTTMPYWDGLISLLLWSLLTLIVGYISLKPGRIRVILDGEPTIIIKKGKILEKAMAGCHLNMDDLSMMLREKNIFSLGEVEYAIFEPDGEISILKKAEHQSLTKQDVKLSEPSPLFVPTEIIVDGKIVERNLRELNLSQEWLEKELRKQQISSVQEVFYAEVKGDGTLYIDKKEDLLQ